VFIVAYDVSKTRCLEKIQRMLDASSRSLIRALSVTSRRAKTPFNAPDGVIDVPCDVDSGFQLVRDAWRLLLLLSEMCYKWCQRRNVRSPEELTTVQVLICYHRRRLFFLHQRANDEILSPLLLSVTFLSCTLGSWCTSESKRADLLVAVYVDFPQEKSTNFCTKKLATVPSVRRYHLYY